MYYIGVEEGSMYYIEVEEGSVYYIGLKRVVCTI